jgi:hypothetical protein
LKIRIDVGDTNTEERFASVEINPDELACVHLHMASPEKRNRTGHYLRRHPLEMSEVVDPNKPIQSKNSYKIPMPEHIKRMETKGLIPSKKKPFQAGGETYSLIPTMLAVPVSDLVANLLRPSYHEAGLGKHKLFYFQGEPIEEKTYWCICLFNGQNGQKGLAFRNIRFDTFGDRALDAETGDDLTSSGLQWAAALVPLIVDGNALTVVDIARNDYDLRQILGRGDAHKPALQYAYQGWYKEWDARVEKIVREHEKMHHPFATFYHSILGIDKENTIHIRQVEGTLPDLTKSLTDEGIIAAGLLDSGGSCAIYDVWMSSYLNHGWYFREPRGSILVFELTSTERVPIKSGDS